MPASHQFIAALLFTISCRAAARLTFRPDGSFKILHVSDTHFHIPDNGCLDVFPSGTPCTAKNTTDFIARLIASEKPDLVVYTGDIVDFDTHPSAEGMNELYGLSESAAVPWVASLGNHEPQSDLTRQQVMSHIVHGMRGDLGLSQVNPLGPNQTVACGGGYPAKQRGDISQTCAARFGTFYLDIFPATGDASKPGFRTFHFDSTEEDEANFPGQHCSIIPAQVEWFRQTAAALKKRDGGDDVAAVAFFHIPLREMNDAVNMSGAKISGSFNEPISFSGQDGSFFDALVDSGSIKATFSGHDHTNDFCVKHPAGAGIEMCYEGSPGYGAYGRGVPGYPRRARVTQILESGKVVKSWKRLDDGHDMSTKDVEILWAANSSSAGSLASAAAGSMRRKPVRADDMNQGDQKMLQLMMRRTAARRSQPPCLGVAVAIPVQPCSGSSGPTCCHVGANCTSVGVSGCCQGAQDCGVNKTCYCIYADFGAQKTCHACTKIRGDCRADGDCCDGFVCDPYATKGRTCCGGDGGYCKNDDDCCGQLKCERLYGHFSCH